MNPSQNQNGRKRAWTLEKAVPIVNPATGRASLQKRVLVRWIADPSGKIEQRTFDGATEARRFAVRKEDELSGLRPGVGPGGDAPLLSEWADSCRSLIAARRRDRERIRAEMTEEQSQLGPACQASAPPRSRASRSRTTAPRTKEPASTPPQKLLNFSRVP